MHTRVCQRVWCRGINGSPRFMLAFYELWRGKVKARGGCWGGYAGLEGVLGLKYSICFCGNEAFEG